MLIYFDNAFVVKENLLVTLTNNNPFNSNWLLDFGVANTNTKPFKPLSNDNRLYNKSLLNSLLQANKVEFNSKDTFITRDSKSS